MSDDIDELLAFDPLYTAELVTGEQNSNASIGLGFMLHRQHTNRKQEVLRAMNDTTFSNTVDYYTSVLDRLGFEKVLHLPISYINQYYNTPVNDEYFVYAHRNGIILAFDTHQSTNVNSATMYYNIEFTDGLVREWYNVVSSGSFDTEMHNAGRHVWCGTHDAREALVHKFNKLTTIGNPLSKWHKRQWFWLVHYGDKYDSNGNDIKIDYEGVTAERLKKMPSWVQDMVGENID